MVTAGHRVLILYKSSQPHSSSQFTCSTEAPFAQKTHWVEVKLCAVSWCTLEELFLPPNSWKTYEFLFGSINIATVGDEMLRTERARFIARTYHGI